MMRTAFQEVATVIRTIDPDRAILTGNSVPRTYAESLRLGQDPLVLDSRDSFRANLGLVNELPFDTVAIHMYPEELTSERFETGHFPSYAELLAEAIGAAQAIAKPLYLGEFGANDLLRGGPAAAQEHIQSMFDALVATRVDLASISVFDRVVDVDSVRAAWSITRTNNRNYVFPMIRAVSEALITGIGNYGDSCLIVRCPHSRSGIWK